MSVITTHDRRTFLRGLGALVAVPSMRSLATPPLAEPPASPPIRLAWVFFPNGTNYERWRVTGTGTDWSSETLTGLGDTRDDVLALSGLSQMNARALGDGGGDHARSAAAFLTGVHPLKTSSSKLGVGQSIDQAAAAILGKSTRLRSIELGIEPSRVAGSCDSGYPCAYQSNISWRSPSQPMPKETNPRLAFERMFGTRDHGGNSSNRRIALRKSVLDMVTDDVRRLRNVLGGEDRKKLDEYLQSIRDTEQLVERSDQPVPKYVVDSPLPEQEPSTPTERMRLMFDLLTLAFRSDTSRIATLMLANDGSDHAYQEIAVRQGHHALSHHQGDEEKIEQIAKIDKHLVTQFASFVRKLRETPDGEGTLLDNSLVLYGGGISDGNYHNHDNLPLLLAGRGGGAISPGRHVAYPNETPLSNFYLSMLDIAGAPLQRFGDSTGRVGQLSV